MCEPVHTSRSIYLVVANSTIYFVPASSAWWRGPVGAQSGIDWGRAPLDGRRGRATGREPARWVPSARFRRPGTARDGLAETLQKKAIGRIGVFHPEPAPMSDPLATRPAGQRTEQPLLYPPRWSGIPLAGGCREYPRC